MYLSETREGWQPKSVDLSTFFLILYNFGVQKTAHTALTVQNPFLLWCYIDKTSMNDDEQKEHTWM